MLFVLLLIFAGTAYYDYLYKRIPDVFTAIGWFLLTLEAYFFAKPEYLTYAGASFAIFFLVNALIAQFKEPVLSWGDILLIPVYVGYSVFMANSPGELTLFLLAPLALLFLYVSVTGKNKNVALAPFLFMAALIALAA